MIKITKKNTDYLKSYGINIADYTYFIKDCRDNKLFNYLLKDDDYLIEIIDYILSDYQFCERRDFDSELNTITVHYEFKFNSDTSRGIGSNSTMIDIIEYYDHFDFEADNEPELLKTIIK